MLATLAGCRMVAGKRRSERTVPRQRLHCTVFDVEVVPPPGEVGNGTYPVDARVAPVAAAESEQLEEGSKVELAGLVRDLSLDGIKGIALLTERDG